MRKGHLIWVLAIMLLSGLAQNASAQWEMIGPDGVPDHIVKIDSFIYATTNYGFFESSNDGHTWRRIDKGLQKRYGHSYNFHYDGFELYMPAAPFSEGGTDRGVYILDRTNAQWKYADSTHGKLYTPYTVRVTTDTCVTILPNYSLRHLENIDTPGVYLSTNRGATWTRRVLPGGIVFQSIHYDKGRLFVAVNGEPISSSGRLYHSDDLGATWKENSIGTIYEGAIQFYGPYNGFLLIKADGPNLTHSCLRSIDRGDSWTSVADLSTVNAATGIQIDNDAFLSVNNLTLRSRDSGANWEVLKTHEGKYFTKPLKRNDGGFLAYVQDPSSLTLYQFDTDFANKEPVLNTGFITTDHWLLHATDSLLIIFGTTMYNQVPAVDSVLVSTDRGDSWSTRSVNTPGLGLQESPWVQGDKHIFALGTPGLGQYSFVRSDNGVDWEDISPEQPSQIKNLPRIISVTNDTLLVNYIDVLGEHQYRMSIDGGTTWGIVQPPSQFIKGACFHNGYLYVMQSALIDELYRTVNGLVWEEVTLPLGNASQRGFPGVMFSLDGVLFISAESYSISLGSIYHLFRSTDGGSTWTDVGEQFGLWGSDVQMVYKGSMMYLVSMGDFFGGPPGGHPKLSVSSDRGATWKPFNNGIPKADRLAITASDLYAWSWDGGIYRWSNPTVKVRKHTTLTQSLSVFPNPAISNITVSHTISEPGHYTYSIVGMTGSIIFTTSKFFGEIGEAVFDLSVAEFPSGIYCVRILGPQAPAQQLFTIVR